MSITDELRKWGYGFCGDTHDVVTAIADRIDAEHQKAIRELNNLADASVLLPVDADGVPIHIGDRMENNERVARIVLTDDSWEPSVYLEKLPNVLHEYFCNEISHHHAPTVEDVLREFTDEVWNRCCEGATASDSGIDGLVAEYSAKLRLAGDGE